eukprot:Trichotokara_eunicae@DN9769_c0_g1_i1.p1
MSIIYGLVAKDTVVLAEYTERRGNFQTVTRMLLPRLPTKETSKMSYDYDEHMFHYITRGGWTFVVMTQKSLTLRTAYVFLEDIADRFLALVETLPFSNTVALSLNNRFAPVLQERMRFYNSVPNIE